MNFILKTQPRHLEEHVALDTKLVIFFMIDVDRHSIQSEYVVLMDMQTQQTVPVQVAYQNRILTVTPQEKLLPDTHYQLHLIGGKIGLKDITGRVLEETYEVEFYTDQFEELKPPEILNPTHQSVVAENIVIQWIEAKDAFQYELEISKSNRFDVVVWPTSKKPIFNLQVRPDLVYEKGNYYIRIRSVRADGARSAWSKTLQIYYGGLDQEKSVPLEPQPFAMASARLVSKTTSVNTELKPMTELQVLKQHLTTQALSEPSTFRILSVKPEGGKLHLPLNSLSKIEIEFSEDISPDNFDQQGTTSTKVYIVPERN